ncbi:MAG TPA: nitroreductase family protein [Acidimicrobiales bacterium]|nr:nitroreductase family protein [Acidimicrobiales bacterium]
MEFQDVVRRRRMVRNFDSRPLSPELVERVLANALRGPSAGFTQGAELLVLEGAEQTRRYWNACFPAHRRSGFRWPGVLQAPLLIIPCACREAYLDRYAEPDKGWIDRDRARWPVAYWDVDAGFVTLLALLTAVDAGLGALFFRVFEPDALRAEFAIPDRFSPVGAVAIGYPLLDQPSPSVGRGRRPPSEVLHRGGW